MSELTYAQKKYLFAIYKLGQNGGEVKSADENSVQISVHASERAVNALVEFVLNNNNL